MRQFEENPKIRNLHDAAAQGRADLIEKLVQSEEQLNKLNNGHHALWYAVRANHVFFIQSLLKFSAEKGWRIIEGPPHVHVDSALDFALRANNFFCAQALALHLHALPDIFSFQRAHIHKLNQIPLTVIALTKERNQRKLLLAAALLEGMKYPGTYENLLRIGLLLELGANPHVTFYDGENFICPLAISAGKYSASASMDPSGISLLSLLLASLNSKTINLHREFYESSIQKFFEREVQWQQELCRLAETPGEALKLHKEKKGEIIWGAGGGFLHWAAAMGHAEILYDIIESFYAHNYQSQMFNKDVYGNTPLTYALRAGHEAIAELLLVEQLRLPSLGKHMSLLNKLDQVYLLKFLNSKEIDENLEFYQTSLNNFFQRPEATCSSLLHWAAFSRDHARIVPCIIECFRRYGIPLHHRNRGEQTPLDIAKVKGRAEIVKILENTEEVKIQRFQPKIPDLSTKLLRDYQKKVLAGEMSIAELEKIMPPELLAKLEELKPNVKMLELLNPKFYEEEGKTPLMVLCEQNRVDLVQRLLPFLTGDDIRICDLEEGNTAYHLACATKASDVLRFLSQKHRYVLDIQNKSGLIPILCAGPLERKDIFQEDNSGCLLDLFTRELNLNLRALLRKQARIIILQIPGGFFTSLSFQDASNKELGRQMESLVGSGKTEELISFLIERLENAPEESIRLLEGVNNNAVLTAALGLSQKNLAHDSVREDYRKLVLDRLQNLDLELKSFNRELNSLGKR